jgi:hypothetical protein
MIDAFSVNSLSDIELKVNGAQTIEEILVEALRNEAERRGIETGRKEVLESLKAEIVVHIKEYFSAVVRLQTEIKEKVSIDFPKAEIIDFKTFFLPFSNELSLFVIFDKISIEEDLKLGLLLSKIESEWLLSKNKYCDIMYIRNAEGIDISAIKRDYPFSLKS